MRFIGDAAALAEDLRRFLDGERVLAFREGPMGALSRHLQRRPRAVAAAAVTVGVVVVVVIVAMVAVSRARGRADLARAAQLVEAAERALREPAPDDALAARGLADAALELLPDGSDEALRARARGVVAATARVAPMAPSPPSPPVVDEATIATLPLDGGRRVARAMPDGERVIVRATTTLAMWTTNAAPRVHTPCAPGHSVLDAVPVADGALVLCAPGELLDSVAIDAHGHVGVGTRAGRVRLYDVDGRMRFDVAAHDERVAALTFCDDGAALCSGGWDGRVRVLQRP